METLRLGGALAAWASLYSNHPMLRTVIAFVHVAALIAGGGCAIVADRATLLALRQQEPAVRRIELAALASTHRIVAAALVFVVISGLLLFFADVETFLTSRVFWLKMALFAALCVNGALLRSAERRAMAGTDAAWGHLRMTAIASVSLWFLTTFAGAALPNIG